MGWLLDFIIRILNWIIDQITYIPKKIFSIIMEYSADIINSLIPDSFNTALLYITGIFDGMGVGMKYYSGLFSLGYGITIICAAYLIRFLIRRIPIIG